MEKYLLKKQQPKRIDMYNLMDDSDEDDNLMSSPEGSPAGQAVGRMSNYYDDATGQTTANTWKTGFTNSTDSSAAR